MQRRNQSQDPRGRKALVPRRNDQLSLAARQDRNHVRDNMEKVILDNAAAIRIKREGDNKERLKTVLPVHRNYGKVPRYI